VAELDPALVAALVPRAKAQIRRRMRALRAAYPAAIRGEWSARIVERLQAHPVFAAARSVATFWPNVERGEVDVRALHVAAQRASKRILYPFMQPHRLGGEPASEVAADVTFRTGFRFVSGQAELADRGGGFFEPDPGAPEAARGEVDLVIVPALAVSADGHRLGYGSGFYDVTLPDFCPPAMTVVVAYEFQLLAELPCLEHDVRCRYAVTEKAAYDLAGEAHGAAGE
jgi:5-formyltetrahydrofolate cyclo-ligase